MRIIPTCLLLFVALIINVKIVSQVPANLELKMQKYESHVIVPSKQLSELQKFASWFHQDWDLIFPDFYQGAKMYFNNISAERIKVLKQELKEFLDKYRGSKSSKLEQAWFRLGAEAWQPDLDIYMTLNDFIDLINKGEWGQTDKVILP